MSIAASSLAGLLSHCGSRGFGHALAGGQFRALQRKFAAWDIPLPGDDRELVYAPLGTPEANAYLNDMALGANFATVNHLLINALVIEAFQEIIPGVKGSLVHSLRGLRFKNSGEGPIESKPERSDYLKTFVAN